MESTLEMHPLSDREVFYFRQRQKNRFFQSIVAHFTKQAEYNGLTKRHIATLLDKDPAQITRWFSAPGNLTLDTISDLLLAMNAELDARIVPLDSGTHETHNVVYFNDPAKDQPVANDRESKIYNWK